MKNRRLLISLILVAGVAGLAVTGYALLGTEIRVSYMLLPMNVNELAKQSDMIVIARVKEIQPSVLDAGGPKGTWVWTDVVLDVERTLKGSVNDTNVSVRLGGGTAGGIKMIVSQEASLVQGERVLLFLIKDLGSPRGDHYGVLGALQGKYLLANGLAENKDQMRNTSEKVLISEIASALREQ